MTISSYSSSPSPLAQTIQSLQEEATESLAETKREAMTGDMQAQRKLEFMANEQPSSANSSAELRPSVGSLLNVKA